MNKRAIIFGNGASGRAARELAKHLDYVCEVYDDMLLAEKGESVLKERYDIGIISPGFPSDCFAVEKIKSNSPDIELLAEVEFASRFFNGRIVAVTGTNGKTTTVSLLTDIINRYQRCLYAGNIGVPFSSVVLDELKRRDSSLSVRVDTKALTAVLELSSFQLADIKNMKIDAGVVLNITDDHLDVHKTFENYKRIKNSVYSLLSENGIAAIDFDEMEVDCCFKGERISYSASSEADCCVKNRAVCFKGREIIPLSEIKLIGRHNLKNVLASVSLSCGLGVPLELIRQGVAEFSGLPHRLEYIDRIGDTTFYNDSKSTNPDSAKKALECFDMSSTVVIFGGSDKGSDMSELLRYSSDVMGMVFMGKACLNMLKQAEKIIAESGVAYRAKCLFAKNMDEAVEIAFSLKPKTVLLSPARASFDLYKDYKERGRDFADCVHRLARLLSKECL